jgi:selenoprotein W-related protein
LLRAAYMAQELLSTFAEEIGEVALIPATGGAFSIACDGEVVWERKRDGGFPEITKLKQLIRDRVAPGRELGHVDRKVASE